MLYTAREKVNKWWLRTKCRGIVTTAPIRSGGSELTIVSLVSHLDLTMYMLAIKSLFLRLEKGTIVIINDGTLSNRDVRLLEAQIIGCQIVSAREIKLGRFISRGGCWERLALISEYVEKSYVVQLDSDCLTLQAISEVTDAIRENRSFTLGTGMGRQVSAMKDVCQQMKAYPSDHIQVVAEQSFDRYPLYDRLKYVRGCAGFAGFAKGSFSHLKLEEFSENMKGIVGTMWSNWGSEQVTSNFIIANSPLSCVLPYPKYANFTLDIPYEQSSFLHFFGPYRFRKGIYLRKSAQLVDKLKESRPREPLRDSVQRPNV